MKPELGVRSASLSIELPATASTGSIGVPGIFSVFTLGPKISLHDFNRKMDMVKCIRQADRSSTDVADAYERFDVIGETHSKKTSNWWESLSRYVFVKRSD